MRYRFVFWDIDGTLYDNSGEIPDSEKDILSKRERLESVPDIELRFWIPYDGLVGLMERVPQSNQGVISNGIHQFQMNKLFLLGLLDYINPGLIFTSYGEAEKIIDNLNHRMNKCCSSGQDRSMDIYNMTLETQKPESYMFERALEAAGCSPEDCVMVGDDWIDVAGAKKVGMETIHLEGVYSEDPHMIADGTVVPDYRIRKGDMISLAELLL